MEYGCIGEHLSHSFSREIHKRIGSYHYVLQEIEREKLPEFMKAKDFQGINVTIPYKLDVIPFLDEISETAKSIGAVNTIVKRNDRLMGFNTDFEGMIALIHKIGLELNGKTVLILGTGGTSKTAFAAAQALRAEKIIRVGRSKKPGSITYEEACEQYQDARIILNTTPCGMYPNTENCPVALENFPKLEGVMDAIYNPLRSRLILSAQERGIKAGGGLYMLVAQAVFAAEKFFSCTYPTALIDRVFAEIMKEKENIVLTGMPGSGKTTVGKILAKQIGKEFLDTDQLIAERQGSTPDQIIRARGIETFRKIESDVIREISTKNNCIIATGGGAVLNPGNIMHLKYNGRIFLLDRPLEMIQPTADRPLSSNREKLAALYAERAEIYKQSCDVRIRSIASPEEAAARIAAHSGSIS